MSVFSDLREKYLNNKTITPRKADVEFMDMAGGYCGFPETAIKLAKDVEPFFKQHQKNKTREFAFAKCPGMFDYSRLGYIVPAWDMIKIKANKAGIVCMSKKNFYHKDLEETGRFPDHIIDGFSNPTDIGDFGQYNVTCPWKIRTKRNVSLLILPATYHCKYLDDLHIFPGIVDYDTGFATINCIIAPRRECEIIINIGEPLLHVIPFYRKTFTADYGVATDFDSLPILASPYTPENNFYRKWFMSKKKFKLNFLSKK